LQGTSQFNWVRDNSYLLIGVPALTKKSLASIIKLIGEGEFPNDTFKTRLFIYLFKTNREKCQDAKINLKN
jgi:hypothetical protein